MRIEREEESLLRIVIRETSKGIERLGDDLQKHALSPFPNAVTTFLKLEGFHGDKIRVIWMDDSSFSVNKECAGI